MVKYWVIMILSISDVLCTSNGIANGWVEEGNPILSKAFLSTSFWASMIILTAVMMQITVLYWAERQYKWVVNWVYMIIGAKVLVLFAHIYWIGLVCIYF